MSVLRTAHRRYLLGAVVVLVSMLALPQVRSVSGSRADISSTTTPTLVAPTPVPPDKNGVQTSKLDADDGAFAIISPDPLSKNGSARPVVENATGETLTAVPNPGSKNDDGRIQSARPSDNLAAMLAAGDSMLACGAAGNMNWTTTSSSFQVIRQCTLSVPQAGWVFISADGSLARRDGEYESLFEIGIDTTSGDSDIDRWVNVYNDSGDGTDRSVALSVLRSVTAGTHTFYFLGKRFGGSGTVLVYDPTLTVIAPGARIYLPLVMKGQ